MTSARFGIGEPVPRVEDARLMTGRGQFIADRNLAFQAYAAFVRSPHAAARIVSIETALARAAPGVLAAFTADDLGDELAGTSISYKRARPDGTPMFWRAHPGLARGRVRHVGDPVAMVIADTQSRARDAAELVAAQYEPLEAVVDLLSALSSPNPRVWDECPDNVSNVHEMGDRAATDAAFARAAHVVRRSYAVSRVHAQYLEPRGALATYDPLSGRYTLYCDTQNPHKVRDLLAREILRVPEENVRVVAGDIGGAFGGKGTHPVEQRLLLWAARKLERPVKWIADRSETILADEHGRDNRHEVELALDAEARFLAFRGRWIANVGAYINADRNFQTSFQNVPGVLGVYKFPAAWVRSSCVMTNTGPLAPYRGAGRPEATFVIESLIDDAARELGIDRIELRRRNLIPPHALPLRTPLGFHYDCGEFERCMDLALEIADVSGFPGRREASRARGRLRGLGIANHIERAGPVSAEYAEIGIDALCKATVKMGTKSQGQGHETAFRQLLVSRLSIDPDNVVYVEGDTDRVAQGLGTYGSRSAALGGSALALAADKIVEKATRIAAHLLEAAPSDMVFSEAQFKIAGTDRGVSLQEVAAAAHRPEALPEGMEPGLQESGSFTSTENTFPYGTHVCEVEIDPDTGTVSVERYSVVHDVGNMLNPLIVKGQIHGGVAQGIGQALLERIFYDECGQLLTGSFSDYAIPRADDLCSMDVDDICVPTARNLLGVKGAGEAGAVGALGSTMNAIRHALHCLGIGELEMPATPERVWRAIHRTHGIAAGQGERPLACAPRHSSRS